jgi:hypothetical protein
MALVIARIRRAEERKQGNCAQDHQSVHGEKLFVSLTSAECTEIEYATERYSESPPRVGTKADKGDTAPSLSDEAPTSSRSIYLREIHRQIESD